MSDDPPISPLSRAKVADAAMKAKRDLSNGPPGNGNPQQPIKVSDEFLDALTDLLERTNNRLDAIQRLGHEDGQS